MAGAGAKQDAEGAGAKAKVGAGAQNLYQVLGLSQRCLPVQVRAAHRALARQLHPDVNSAADAHDRFTRVQRAYEVLIDPDKRAEYDRLLAARAAPPTEVLLSPHYTWTSVAARPGRGSGAGTSAGTSAGTAAGTSAGTGPRQGATASVHIDASARDAAQAGLDREELAEDVAWFWRVLFEPRRAQQADRAHHAKRAQRPQ